MTYRGYTIEESEHLYKPCFDFYPTAEGIDCDFDGERYRSNVKSADTLEEAKSEIDEILGEVEPVKATFTANTGRLLLHKKVNGLIFLTPIPFII